MCNITKLHTLFVVDSLSCFKLASHLKREYMAFLLFIVMKIMVVYCLSPASLESVPFCSSLSLFFKMFCFVSSYSNLCSSLISSDIEQLHTAEKNIIHNCIFYIQSYRKIHTANNHEASDDEEYITIFSTEKHFEVKSGSPENLSGGSSSRYVSVIVFLLLFYTGRSYFVPGLHSCKTLCTDQTQNSL